MENSAKMKVKRKGFERYHRWGYVFLAPFLIGFLVFQLYPILYTIYLSFSDLAGWATESDFIGMRNFVNLFNNEIFRQSIQNTFILWILNFIPQILVALLLAAWFTNVRLKMRGQGFFKTLLYMPNIITAASVAVIFFALFAFPRGPINIGLMNVGILEEAHNFFLSVWGLRGIIIFIQFWMWYGPTMLILISGILSINTSLFESAMVDGATDGQIFRNITLPLLRPILLYTLVTSLIGGLQMFDIPFLLTNGMGGFQNTSMTITMFVYNQAFTAGRNFGVAAAASVILLGISIVLSLVMFRLFREKK